MSDIIKINLTSKIKGKNVVLFVRKNDLPPVDELCDVLSRGGCDLKIWINMALEYYRQNQTIEFLKLLHKALEIIPKNYNHVSKDILKVLDLMGAYCTQQAFNQEDQETKEQFVKTANEYFTIGDQMSIIDEYHLLGRAFLNLLNSPDTNTHFDIILDHSPKNILALLGKAWMQYNKRQYDKALETYINVLDLSPACRKGIHVAIGHCLSNLCRIVEAKISYNVALDWDPNCIDALIGLALLHSKENSSLPPKICSTLLRKALNIDPNNPNVINHMSNLLILNSNYGNVKSLCEKALQQSNKNNIRAQSFYHLARFYHAKMDYDHAFEYYFKSAQFADHQFYLPLYGLGLMYINREETEKAEHCFEKVLDLEPKSYDCMRVLGSLYSKSKSKEIRQKGCVYLKKITDALPNEYDALIDYAQLMEEFDMKKSLQAYKNACQIMEALYVDIPSEVLNNMAAISYRMENFTTAHNYLELALLANNKIRMKNVEYYDSIAITMKYNLARIQEILQSFNDADKLYKEVLNEHPNYVDCYLRLGCIAREKGQIFVASDFFKDVLNVDKNHGNARCLLGSLHMTKDQLSLAQKHFESILRNPETTDDSYALIALGNIGLQASQQTNEDIQKQYKYLDRALSFYEKVLLKESGNVWAANGIGSVLAHKGCIKEALNIFTNARDAAAFDSPEMMLNIGHCYVLMKNYESAIKMYDLCSKKFYKNHNVEVLHYLANAYYCANRFQESIRTLKIARHLAPNDPVLLYNISIALKMFARSTLSLNCTLEEATSAKDGLSMALQYFDYLLKIRSSHIKTSECEIEINSCNDILVQAKSTISSIIENYEQLQPYKISEKILKSQAEKKIQKEEKKLQFAQMEKERREINDAKRRQFLLDAKRVLASVSESQVKVKKSTKNNAVEPRAVDFLLPDSALTRPTKKIRKTRESKTADDNKNQSRKPKTNKTSKQRLRVLSKAYISSSDSDSDETIEENSNDELPQLEILSEKDDFDCSSSASPSQEPEISFPEIEVKDLLLRVQPRQPFAPVNFTARRRSRFRPILSTYAPRPTTSLCCTKLQKHSSDDSDLKSDGHFQS